MKIKLVDDNGMEIALVSQATSWTRTIEFDKNGEYIGIRHAITLVGIMLDDKAQANHLTQDHTRIA